MWMSWRMVGVGVLSWVLPFLFSCAFFNRRGELTINVTIFKVIMFATFSVLGAVLLDHVLHPLLRDLGPGERFLPTALQVGAFFALVNCLLDVLVLVPIVNSGRAPGAPPRMTVPQWFREIGAVYIAIVAQAWLAGRFADHALIKNGV